MSHDDFVTQLFLACVQNGEIDSSTSPKTAAQRMEKLLHLYDHVRGERRSAPSEPAAAAGPAAGPIPTLTHERIAPKL